MTGIPPHEVARRDQILAHVADVTGQSRRVLGDLAELTPSAGMREERPQRAKIETREIERTTSLAGWALRCRCTTCGASPGRLCDAPRRAAQVARLAENMARAGLPQRPLGDVLLALTHARRQDCGHARRRRQVRA